MAQTGYTPILIYSSTTASQNPSASNLTNSTLGSELAINITDGKLFYKDNGGSVQVIGWKTVPTSAGGTGLTSYTAGDTLYYATGTTLSKLAIGASKTIMTSSGTAPQWSTSLDTTQGGTGLTSYTAGDLPYYATGTILSKLGIGAADYVLTSSGTAPQWSQFLKATAGGTGQTSYAVGDILYASSTTALSKLADVATGNALISGGVGVAPSWGKIGLTTHVSGTLGVGNGGTGITTTPTNGQIPIGNGTNYVAATLTAGAGIGITNASGAITVAVNTGPAFSVYRTTSNQSLTTATFTKVQLNAEEYDTNNNFDSSTNYRFTPTVAGYYQISGSVGLTGTNTRILCAIYKNGSEYFRGQDASVNLSQVTVSGLVYFNGSTDYVELYVFATFVGTSDIAAGQKYTYLTGVLVRGA